MEVIILGDICRAPAGALQISLGGYDYSIHYKEGKDMGNADPPS